MVKTVLLDNVQHHDLRVLSGHRADFGDATNLSLISPTEFADIQREYPILFQHDERGQFQAVALLGLDRDENLFLDGNVWQARYIPALHRRGPFLIGHPDAEAEAQGRREPMVLVDLEHPRISPTEGEALFLTHGGNSPHLERMMQALRTLYQGPEVSQAMFQAFADAKILAPVNINIKLDDATEYRLPDFFSVSREALTELDAATLERLNRQGFLALAYHVVASTGNMARIIDMKNRKRAGAQSGHG